MGLVIASIHERRDEFREILKKSNPNRDPDRAVFQARRRVGKAHSPAMTGQATQVDS
jgi:monovalent cation:H+ antiporter-2, CPA2 family